MLGSRLIATTATTYRKKLIAASVVALAGFCLLVTVLSAPANAMPITLPSGEKFESRSVTLECLQVLERNILNEDPRHPWYHWYSHYTTTRQIEAVIQIRRAITAREYLQRPQQIHGESAQIYLSTRYRQDEVSWANLKGSPPFQTTRSSSATVG